MYENADVEKMQAPIDERRARQMAREILEKQRAFEPRETCGQVARAYNDDEIVAEFFKYHPPNELTIPKYAAINQAAKNFAEVLLANCPRGADRSAAIRLIREARMTANAAVALDGLSL